MAAEDRLSTATKRTLLHELSACIHRGVLIAACALKRNHKEHLTDDLKLPSPTTGDRLLRPQQAGDILGVYRQYFYRHEHELPFTVRLPSGALRISERGLFLWIEQIGGIANARFRKRL